eukprot:scaffold3207_cov165-Skeletonema_marinoi.AAC.4
MNNRYALALIMSFCQSAPSTRCFARESRKCTTKESTPLHTTSSSRRSKQEALLLELPLVGINCSWFIHLAADCWLVASHSSKKAGIILGT